MAKKIALFNHKGGVSKTTTTFHLGWMLASKGKKVVLADFDPQCNLTGVVLDYKGPNELEELYQNKPQRNIRAGLLPAFESQPRLISEVDCLPVDGRDGLYLLPGHIGISEWEVTLGIAQTLSGSIPALLNLPGSIPYLLDKTAEAVGAEYVLIDTSPSLSSFNQNILMTSDFFLVPTSPDFYSAMAIDSLSKVFPEWHSWALQANGIEALKKATYPFPSPHSKFLGTIIQNYRPRGGANPARSFRNWMDEIESKVKDKLSPTLAKNDMMLPKEKYQEAKVNETFTLSTIPNFNSLIAKSQEFQTPVYALTDEQIGQGV